MTDKIYSIIASRYALFCTSARWKFSISKNWDYLHCHSIRPETIQQQQQPNLDQFFANQLHMVIAYRGKFSFFTQIEPQISILDEQNFFTLPTGYLATVVAHL